MKTAVVFYSFTGMTKKFAEDEARRDNAELIEIKEKKPYSKPGAYIFGSLHARGRKKAVIEPGTADFDSFDRILVAVPLWAGFPAPPFNNILELLPGNTEIELFITSASGNSGGSKEKTISFAASKNIRIVKYQDIKTTV